MILLHSDLAAQVLHFNNKQASSLFSVVKALHQVATRQHLTIDRAFDAFKELLLRHSVHRSVVPACFARLNTATFFQEPDSLP